MRSIPDESQHPFLTVIGFFFHWPLSSHCHYPICSDMHDLQHLCQIIRSVFLLCTRNWSKHDAGGANRDLGLVIFFFSSRKSQVSITEVNCVCSNQCSETLVGHASCLWFQHYLRGFDFFQLIVKEVFRLSKMFWHLYLLTEMFIITWNGLSFFAINYERGIYSIDCIDIERWRRTEAIQKKTENGLGQQRKNKDSNLLWKRLRSFLLNHVS